MVKRKLDGEVDESSADQEIRKFDAIVHNMRKYGGLHQVLWQAGCPAGRHAGCPADETWVRLAI